MFSAPFVMLGTITLLVVRATRRYERESRARAE